MVETKFRAFALRHLCCHNSQPESDGAVARCCLEHEFDALAVPVDERDWPVRDALHVRAAGDVVAHHFQLPVVQSVQSLGVVSENLDELLDCVRVLQLPLLKAKLVGYVNEALCAEWGAARLFDARAGIQQVARQVLVAPYRFTDHRRARERVRQLRCVIVQALSVLERYSPMHVALVSCDVPEVRAAPCSHDLAALLIRYVTALDRIANFIAESLVDLDQRERISTVAVGKYRVTQQW